MAITMAVEIRTIGVNRDSPNTSGSNAAKVTMPMATMMNAQMDDSAGNEGDYNGHDRAHDFVACTKGSDEDDDDGKTAAMMAMDMAMPKDMTMSMDIRARPLCS